MSSTVEIISFHFTFISYNFGPKLCADTFFCFTRAVFLYRAEKLRCAVDIALLLLILFSEIKCAVKLLYTDRKGRVRPTM